MPASDPDVSRPRLIRNATFLEVDRREIGRRRGHHNQLGFAYQVAFVRVLGRFPQQAPLEIDGEILRFAALQLGADAETIYAYARRQQTVSEHQQRIGQYLRLHTFDTDAGERLAQFLEDEALRLERTTSLLARARDWLRDEHILAPADSMLRRAVGAARNKTRALLTQRMAERLSSSIRDRLDALVCFLHQAWRDTLDQAVDMYGELLDRNRKLAEDRLDEMLKAQRHAVDRIVHRYHRLGAVLLDPDIGDAELRARLLSTVPETELREDQSDLANWTRGDRKARFEQTADRHAGLSRFAAPFLSRMKFVDEQGEGVSPTLSALRVSPPSSRCAALSVYFYTNVVSTLISLLERYGGTPLSVGCPDLLDYRQRNQGRPVGGKLVGPPDPDDLFSSAKRPTEGHSIQEADTHHR